MSITVSHPKITQKASGDTLEDRGGCVRACARAVHCTERAHAQHDKTKKIEQKLRKMGCAGETKSQDKEDNGTVSHKRPGKPIPGENMRGKEGSNTQLKKPGQKNNSKKLSQKAKGK